MHRYANPARFLKIARALTAPLALAGLLAVAAGLYIGLFASPPDYQQGESVRIMYVHVPAAWLGLGGYLGLGIAAAVYMVWRHPLADVAARAIAPVGATFAAICLISGALWGRPTWGTYWVWDARLTSMLVLFFLYLGYSALRGAFDDEERAAKAASILAIVGLVNLPIVKFSVEWWNTLHQPASIGVGSSAIHADMLRPLLISALGFQLLFAGMVLMRMRALLAKQVLAARAARLAGAHG
jgi:heme exporter protein C